MLAWSKVFLSNNVTLTKENFWLELSADSIFIDYLNSVKSSQNMENDIKMSPF